MDLPAKFPLDGDPETILAKVELSHYLVFVGWWARLKGVLRFVNTVMILILSI